MNIAMCFKLLFNPIFRFQNSHPNNFMGNLSAITCNSQADTNKKRKIPVVAPRPRVKRRDNMVKIRHNGPNHNSPHKQCKKSDRRMVVTDHGI